MTTVTTQTSTENNLLAALPREEYERLAPHLGEVSLTLRQVLFTPAMRSRMPTSRQ